jgi:hypothetical protein
MDDVERIAWIEESALPPEKQDVIRYCTLQIAHLAGKNGCFSLGLRRQFNCWRDKSMVVKTKQRTGSSPVRCSVY